MVSRLYTLSAVAKNAKQARKKLVNERAFYGGGWLDFKDWRKDKKNYDGIVGVAWRLLDKKPRVFTNKEPIILFLNGADG